jgi:hypothetical protein
LAEALRRAADGAARLRLPLVALGAVMAAAVILLLYHGRDFSFFGDEWSFILDRRTQTLDDFLLPHNEHFSAVPVAIYKVMWKVFGLDGYLPYRLLLLGLHLTAGALLFVLARRRVGDWAAVVAAALVLLFGQGWEDLLWAFQIGFVLSLTAGLGALVALDRRDRAGDIAAAVLLMVALASSGTGVPMLAIAAIELLWREDRWRRIWVAAAPGAVYGLWSVQYGESALKLKNLPDAPEYAATTIAGTVGPLVGLGVDFGRPLAILGAAVVVWRLSHPGVLTPRAAALVGGLVFFAGTLGLSRADIAEAAPPDASRYVYLGAFLVVLLAVELARGVRLGQTALALLAGLALVAAVSNVSALRLQGDTRRAQIDALRAQVGAVLIARDHVDLGFPLTLHPHGPNATAGGLIAATDDLGSPAFGHQDLLARTEDARSMADQTLVGALGLEPAPAPPGPCRELARGGAGAPLDVEVPAGGVRVDPARGTRAELRLRRYTSVFGPAPTFVLDGRPAVLAIPRDRSPQPWRIQVVSDAPVALCSLG